METEIKTLVYRDRAETTKTKQSKISRKFHKLSQLNRVLVIMATSLLVLASATGVMAGIAFSENSAVAAENLNDSNEFDGCNEKEEFMVAEVTAVSADTKADDISENTESASAHTGLKTAVNFADATVEQRADAAEENATKFTADLKANASLEENIILQLLSDATGEEENEFIYIPPTLGLNSDDGEAEDTFTRLDEIAEEAEKYIAPEGSPSSLVYKYNPKMMLELSKHEIEVLERIVEAEATGMDVYGRMLVANVVINRVHSKYFANDVESVVFQKIGGSYQFAPIKDGRYKSVKVTSLSREAVKRVLAGEDYSQGALYFFQRSSTSKSKATWFDKNLKYLFKYGAHEFFTEWK